MCVWAGRVSAQCSGWILSFLWAIWLQPKQITSSPTDQAEDTRHRWTAAVFFWLLLFRPGHQ